MASRHKLKVSPSNALKAEIIRRWGTIDAFATAKEFRRSSVYAALKFRRNGPGSQAIREAVNS